jgi:ABC-type phosphate transport system substrate-binding protein
VAGTAKVGPILDAAAEALTAQASQIIVEVERTSSGNGLERFCTGETDLATSGRQIRDEEVAACAENWDHLRRIRGRLTASPLSSTPSTRLSPA